mmetsp:Transcript_16527/g.57883  ORF Transcript_16527/g.57883 Transcript_16527/m.57883 type:complete len:282 (+) Transcript_16527:803-1648(+)
MRCRCQTWGISLTAFSAMCPAVATAPSGRHHSSSPVGGPTNPLPSTTCSCVSPAPVRNASPRVAGWCTALAHSAPSRTRQSCRRCSSEPRALWNSWIALASWRLCRAGPGSSIGMCPRVHGSASKLSSCRIRTKPLPEDWTSWRAHGHRKGRRPLSLVCQVCCSVAGECTHTSEIREVSSSRFSGVSGTSRCPMGLCRSLRLWWLWPQTPSRRRRCPQRVPAILPKLLMICQRTLYVRRSCLILRKRPSSRQPSPMRGPASWSRRLLSSTASTEFLWTTSS